MYFQRDQIVTRIRKIADTGRTGVLRSAGDSGGSIYFTGGHVVYAESRRTPDPARLAQAPAPLGAGSPVAGPDRQPAREAVTADAGRPGTSRSLHWDLAVREATVDAVFDLVSTRPRHPSRHRFHASETPRLRTEPIPLDALLTEVARRQQVMRQLSRRLSPDTAVTRSRSIDPRGVRVSACQWALLIRARGGSTPRSLAWAAGHSVFSATVEVFRLVVLGLLTVVEVPYPPVRRTPEGAPDRPLLTMSFVRAVTR